MQAVQSSDFAIGEFKILRRLLLFHGRTNYIRIAEMVLYFFYKNFVFSINHFYFAFYTNFSAQTIMDSWFITLYNLILTAFPLGARAATDFDIKPDDGVIIDQCLPFLYKETKENPIFTKTSFLLSLFRGVVHGILNFMFLTYNLGPTSVNSLGQNGDIWYFSVLLYTNILSVRSNYNMA
jgi:magnesium-transporting ATPase (P-type)